MLSVRGVCFCTFGGCLAVLYANVSLLKMYHALTGRIGQERNLTFHNYFLWCVYSVVGFFFKLLGLLNFGAIFLISLQNFLSEG